MILLAIVAILLLIIIMSTVHKKNFSNLRTRFGISKDTPLSDIRAYHDMLGTPKLMGEFDHDPLIGPLTELNEPRLYHDLY